MGSGFFPKMLPFCECNSVRIGQNIQNEVSLERYIFADVVAYQFIQLKLKAKWVQRECGCILTSFHMGRP